MAMARTNFALSLEELTGLVEDSPDEAPTGLVASVRRSWKKPLAQLSDEEIGRLVIQHCGYPYVLDLVWPKLECDPLFEGGYYPGDVLSNLLKADPSIWADRPEYRARLGVLCERALARRSDDSDAFRESLDFPRSRSLN